MNRVTVPTLTVAGWWDQEDFYGPVTIYERLERYDTQHMNYLVVGPWNHGGWMGPEGQKLGAIDFGSPTSLYFRQHIMAPFFAHFLKDQPGFDLPTRRRRSRAAPIPGRSTTAGRQKPA